MRRLPLFALSLAAVTGFAAPALADTPMQPTDVIASYCAGEDLACTTAKLFYEKQVELPIAFDWDTGWIPSGKDIQVRFFVKVPAYTRVELGGHLNTQWPQPMTHSVVGQRETGLIFFDYGFEIGAKGKAKKTVKVLGKEYGIDWEGDLPYLPNYNYHLKGAKVFTPWAFEESLPAQAFSPRITILDVNVLGPLGVPSVIAKGGFKGDLQGELAAYYRTDRMVVQPVKEGPEAEILSKDEEKQTGVPSGAFVEYDVWPEGKVRYEGVLHFIASAYMEAIKGVFKISFDLKDWQVPLKLGDTDFVFDPIRVHVPLPDFMELGEGYTIDFGTVETGNREKKNVQLANVGEAKARAAGLVEDSGKDVFKLAQPSALVDPNAVEDVEVRFQPKKAGKYESTLTFITNDPDQRFMKVTLKGEAVGQDVDYPDYPDDPPDNPVKPTAQSGEDDSGCGCRTAGGKSNDAPVGGLALLGAALVAARRRRRNHN